MDRRKALRTIGFGTTAITVTPAVVGMLQSCQSQTSTFTATLFSKDQFAVLFSSDGSDHSTNGHTRSDGIKTAGIFGWVYECRFQQASATKND